MRNRLYAVLLTMGLISLAVAGWAQSTQVMWRLNNGLGEMPAPPYRGQPSPFPTKEVAAAPLEAGEVDVAAQRALVLENLKRLMEPSIAFRSAASGMTVRGVTRGANGPRVLLGSEWVGEGDTLKLQFGINPKTRQALRDLQALDAETAQAKANQLNAAFGKLQSQATKVDKIDFNKQNVRLKTPLGGMDVPFQLPR